MAGLKYLFGIFFVAVLVLVLIFYDGYGIPDPTVPLSNFVVETTKFADGSIISLLKPDQPIGEKSTSVPVTKKVVTDENGTQTIVEEPVEDVVLPVENVPQYSKSDPNGVVVQGYIILTDASTGQPIKPYLYDVLVEIRCDDELNEEQNLQFCTTSPIFGRIPTENGGKDEDGNDLGGYFIYKWRASATDTLGFYNVKITITSDQKNAFGQYDNYEKSYKVQLLE